MVLPLGLGLSLGWYLLPESNYHFAQTLFLGTALAVTAVPVAIKVLMDLGKLESKLGQVVVFFFLAGLMGKYLFPFIGSMLRKSRAEEFEFSALLIAALSYALLAEKLGMHFILGAFLAGLFFVRSTIDENTYKDIFRKTSGLTTGFFAPVFFASIGLHLSLAALWSVPWLVLILVLAATFGKVVGAGLAARMLGFSNHESLAIGAGMNARGAVELIVADIALRAGLFSQPSPASPEIEFLFSAVVIMAVVTTIITPPILKISLSRN